MQDLVLPSLRELELHYDAGWQTRIGPGPYAGLTRLALTNYLALSNFASACSLRELHLIFQGATDNNISLEWSWADQEALQASLPPVQMRLSKAAMSLLCVLCLSPAQGSSVISLKQSAATINQLQCHQLCRPCLVCGGSA